MGDSKLGGAGAPMNTVGMGAVNPALIGAINSAPYEVCPECGCNVFVEGVMLKRISGLILGSREDKVIPLPVYVCKKCGQFAPMYLDDDKFMSSVKNSGKPQPEEEKETTKKATIITE